MNLPKIDVIRSDLSAFQASFEVILFGSVVEGAFRPESDIDIAILTRTSNKIRNIKILKSCLEHVGTKYDIRVFELFPIYIQISIINHFKVIFGNILEISEYFYQFRKQWDDCKHRMLTNQFDSFRDRLSLLHS
jgi:hypothetical protein